MNHIDTAARYGDSELRIGPWMARHRKDFFLATKTGSRGARAAREDLHRSLERLRVDHVDLIQIHSLGHPDDWDQVMGPDGALEALVEARAQGLARAIGVTGHGWSIPAMHRRSLARFDFDSILLPYNFFMVQNDRYREAFGEVIAICRERQRGRPDHQGHRARSLGHRRPEPRHVVSAARAARTTSIGPSTGCSAAPTSSSTPRATCPAAARARGGRPLHAPPSRRGDGGHARRDADVLALRPAHVTPGRAR